MTRPPLLPALTSIRFFAAFLVVIYHFGGPYISKWPEPLRNIISAGYNGVSLFFVLSGFILAYVYIPRETSKRKFWLARFARIYPLYIFSLIIAFPGFLNGLRAGDLLPESAILTPLLLHAWNPGTACAWNCPGWTLSAEAFFYLTFPFLLPVLLRVSQKNLTLCGVLSWVLMIIPPFVYIFTQADGLTSSSSTNTEAIEILKYNPALHLGEFGLGIVAGIAYYRGLRLPSPALAASIAGLLILLVLSMSPFIPFPILHNGLLAGAYAFLVVALASIQSGWIISRPLVLLGEASYALYLLHFPLWFIFLRLIEHFGVATESSWVFPVYLGAMLVGSIVAYRLIELPAQRWILRRK